MREEEGQKEREMVEKIGQKEGQFSASGRNSFHLETATPSTLVELAGSLVSIHAKL